MHLYITNQGSFFACSTFKVGRSDKAGCHIVTCHLYQMDDDTNSQKTILTFHKARQTRFIVSYQCLLPLRPATSTVIIAFQAMTSLL